MYNKRVEGYFFNPKHVGILDLSENYTASYRGGEAGRGDVIDLYLHCDEQGLIINARFKAYGNPYLLAGAEWLCERLEGSTINEHPCIAYNHLLQELEIPKAGLSVALLIEESYRELVQIMKMKLKGEPNE
jgi:nitrogen fixation NifU-like protein